jgi:hypothetical protein
MRRFLLGNPFLLLAIASYLLVQVWFMAPLEVQESLVSRVVFSAASVFLWPFRQLATWVDPHLRGFPEWLDVVGTGLLGALPYILADLAFRRTWRARDGGPPAGPSRTSVVTPAVSPGQGT